MSDKEQIWEDLGIAEHEDAAMQWAEDAFPQFLGNPALIAQLYFTNVLEGTIPPPVDVTTVADLLEKFKKFEPVIGPDGKESKLYATIEVLMVQMLDDSRGYFGCPLCYRKVDRTIGFCTDASHPGEEPQGVQHTFQKWQAGDNTGNIIVTFGPANHQAEADTKNYTMTIQGSVNNRDGTFNAWEIINKKAPKRLRKLTGIKRTVPPEVALEVKEVVANEQSDEDTDELLETAEAATEAIFGSGDVEEEVEEAGLSEREVETITRSFKKLLKQHYTKKPNTTKNLLNWLSVQPQFRKWPKGDERDVIVKEFLDGLEEQGLFAYEDEGKEKIISKLEE